MEQQSLQIDTGSVELHKGWISLPEAQFMIEPGILPDLSLDDRHLSGKPCIRISSTVKDFDLYAWDDIPPDAVGSLPLGDLRVAFALGQIKGSVVEVDGTVRMFTHWAIRYSMQGHLWEVSVADDSEYLVRRHQHAKRIE